MKVPFFIASDESVKNSYGFYVLTSGIDYQSRFAENPVCLNNHSNDTKDVLGSWGDIAVEDGKLKMRPEFDTEDVAGKEVVRKVLAGKIKGASIGITFEPDDMRMIDGKLMLEKCTLFEVSIVAVPSNAGAIALFKADGQEYTENEIKQITLSAQKTNYNPKPKSMKMIATHLSLNEDASEEAVLKAVKEQEKELADQKAALTAKEVEYTALKAKFDALNTANTARLKAELNAELTAAIKDGRIDKSSEASIRELSHDSAMKLLKSLPKREKIAEQMDDAGDSLDRFRKLSWDEMDKKGLLAELKRIDPEYFEERKKAEFGQA